MSEQVQPHIVLEKQELQNEVALFGGSGAEVVRALKLLSGSSCLETANASEY